MHEERHASSTQSYFRLVSLEATIVFVIEHLIFNLKIPGLAPDINTYNIVSYMLEFHVDAIIQYRDNLIIDGLFLL